MIPVRILGTSSLLPGRAVDNDELASTLEGIDSAQIEARTGIRRRYWTPAGTRMSELGAEVLRQALSRAGLDPRDLRRVLFVSSTGGDCTSPATVSSVIEAVGADGVCDGFDINNACTGFLSAFDVAARSVATGLHPVAIVIVEILSRYIAPEDPRPYMVLGDAAAALVLGPGRPGEGVLGAAFGNEGAHGGTAYIPHPGLTKKLERTIFGASNREMGQIVLRAITEGVRRTLEQCSEELDRIEWVLPHQPNGKMLAKIVEVLGVDPARLMPIADEIGSVGAAAIPISLDRLLRERPVRPGDRILMTTVGSGLAYGTILYRVAP